MINLLQKNNNTTNNEELVLNKFEKILSSTIQEEYDIADKCEKGVMLHAWNWYFNDIKNSMKEIAKSGYTSIQVSPIQPNKDGNISSTHDWWKLYQPIDFSIGNTLGNEFEFEEMCNEAKKYGIKIIVDVVSNHLAGNSSNGNNSKWNRNNSIPSYLKENDNFWHNESFGAFYNDNDRTSMTKGAIGMPGLNTGNKELQQIIINFLNKAQELGADGFRFDAAKHIELPNDHLGSDYWPTIINAIKNKNSNSFVYGEILNSCATDIKNYSQYMRVTDNEYGWNVVDAVTNCNAGLAQNYVKNDLASNFVTWVESHDTFAGDYGRKSDYLCDLDIRLAWCIVASRADSVPLFFGRPTNGMHGSLGKGTDTWKDKTVVAVNKFHNNFAGENEYIRILNNNNVFEIERGDSGVVIVNLSHNYSKISTYTNLKDGEYLDHISGNKLTVKDHQLTTELSGKSVTVAYNKKEKQFNSINFLDNLIKINLDNANKNNDTIRSGCLYVNRRINWGKKMYAYIYTENENGTKHIANWPGVEMQSTDNDFSYELPDEWKNEKTQVIFNDGYNQYPLNYNPGAYFKHNKAMIYDGVNINYVNPNLNIKDLFS